MYYVIMQYKTEELHEMMVKKGFTRTASAAAKSSKDKEKPAAVNLRRR